MSKTVQTTTAKPTQAPATSTKDNGVVHVGGSAIRFASVVDAGKVHVGGSAMRF